MLFQKYREFSLVGAMFAWYKKLLLRHFWCWGHCGILTQLSVLLPIVGGRYNVIIIIYRLLLVLYLVGSCKFFFTFCQLNNLCNLCCGWKGLPIKLKKYLPTFVVTFLLYRLVKPNDLSFALL